MQRLFVKIGTDEWNTLSLKSLANLKLNKLTENENNIFSFNNMLDY